MNGKQQQARKQHQNNNSNIHASHDLLLLPDQRLFYSLCLNGTIYDVLLDEFNKRHPTKRPPSRKQFKAKFFKRVVYGDHREAYAGQSKLAAIFRDMFPTVYSFVRYNQKATEADTTAELKRQSFKRLSRRMQQRESQFMIGRVIDRLRRHHADIPVLTVHDSILTTPQHAATVRRVMLEEFWQMQVKPAIRIEGD